MKIAIIGYSGSGKSTLAKFLSSQYKIPLLYLDTVHWLASWNERESSESLEIVEKFLNNNDNWVIDGNYTKLYQKERLQQADYIIFMNFNRINCLYRAHKRNFTYKNRNRESITDGCIEKIDREFLWWLLHNGRKKSVINKYKRIITQYKEKTFVIKNQRELDKFMKNLPMNIWGRLKMLSFEAIYEEDYNTLTEIMKRAFDDDTKMHTDLLEDGPKGYDDGSLIRKLNENPELISSKILSEGKIIGAFSVKDEGEICTLDMIFINPTEKNKGLGLIVWEYMENHYSKEKKWIVETPSYSKRNYNFYTKKCGFTFVCEKFYSKEDSSFVFEKKLV